MVEDIEANPEMQDVLKLHKYIQRIKGKQNEVRTQVSQLQELFNDLDKKIGEVSNQQNKKGMDDMPKPKVDSKGDGKK